MMHPWQQETREGNGRIRRLGTRPRGASSARLPGRLAQACADKREAIALRTKSARIRVPHTDTPKP